MNKIPFAKPIITVDDWKSLKLNMVNNDRLSSGTYNKNFAMKFANYIKNENQEVYCIPVSSCMAALHLSYLTLGIGPGDEVICPAMSHVATAHAIELVGAIPIFVDCDLYGNIDVTKISWSITRKTKAITLVHYNGYPCRMHEIEKIARDYGLKIIEDCALALGVRYYNEHVGTIGDCGCFSFYPSKHIATGEGGMFVCKDLEVYKKAKRIISFGKDGGAYDYDIVELGTNYRLSEMQACLGILQMNRIEEFVKIRIKNEKLYRANFPMVALNMLSPFRNAVSPSPYALVLYGLNNRKELMEKLNENGVGFSIYYPHPIPRLKYYQDKYGYAPIKYPNAIQVADKSIALPVGPHLTDNDIERVVGIVKGVKVLG